MRRTMAVAGLVAALAHAPTQAQQPAPAFAPANLTPAGIRALAAGCASCHGPDGHAVAGAASMPLAGRPAAEIRSAMLAFKRGERPATVMGQLARGYGD